MYPNPSAGQSVASAFQADRAQEPSTSWGQSDLKGGERQWVSLPAISSQFSLKLAQDRGFGGALSNEAQVGDYRNNST